MVLWVGSGVKVYPRVCGGAGSESAFDSAGSGLSPRVRGSQNGRRVSKQQLRSIPACAGEPWEGSKVVDS